MSFKKIAVITDVFEMSTGGKINVNSKIGEPIFVDKIFGLVDALKRNSQYQNKRRWIDIKWEATALLQLEAGNLDWTEYALGELKNEAKALKRLIKFPVRDSYTEAIEDGEELEGYNDYILVIEKAIAEVSNITLSAPVVEEEIEETEDEHEITVEELKQIIKEEGLGLRVIKTDSIESIKERITEARAKLNK